VTVGISNSSLTKGGEEKLIFIKLLSVSQLNRHLTQNLPFPLFAKEGNVASLWRLFPAGGRQREVGRDFIKQSRYYNEAVNKISGLRYNL